MIVADIALFFTKCQSTRSLLLCSVALLLIVGLAESSFWGWYLRDGLGPDSVSSEGYEAIRRFVTGMYSLWIIYALLVVIAVIGFFISKKRIANKRIEVTS